MPLARGSAAALLVVLLLSAFAPAACHATATAWNVTAILDARRGLAEFARALAATGLADAVNGNGGRGGDAVTVLAVDDSRMAETRGALQHEALRRALSRHVLAGYYDDASLRRLLTITGGVGEDLAVVHTLIDEAPVTILAVQGPDTGRVAFAPMGDDGARAAAVFYVGPVAHGSNVSVLLVSGVMWAPLAAPPGPRLQLEPSTAPAPVPPEQAGPSRASAVKFQVHQDGAPATVIPARQVTPRGVSALQEEGGVSSPAAMAASPLEPGPADPTAAAPAPAPPERDPYDTSILTIFGVLLVCYLAVCCCSQ